MTFLKINNLYILPKGVATNVKDMRVFASKQNVGWKEENYRLGTVQFYFFSSKQGQFRWVGNDHYFYVLINDHLPIVVGMHALIFHITYLKMPHGTICFGSQALYGRQGDGAYVAETVVVLHVKGFFDLCLHGHGKSCFWCVVFCVVNVFGALPT